MQHPTIRRLTAQDAEAAAFVFFDAVHNGTADVYCPQQREAWGGSEPDPAGWRNKFAGTTGFAAEFSNELIGFMTLDTDGYIDLAFVRTDMSGYGTGKLLYKEIEALAVLNGIKRLSTEASKKAKPFFERMGWRVDCEQDVIMHGIGLINYRMSKVLN